jgi:aldose 1-epimerase
MTLFGKTGAGDDVTSHTISAGALRVTLLTLGAAVQDVRLDGVDHSLTLGSDDVADYEGDMRHHGTLIGPVANRIANSRVTIDGMTYELERNQDGRIHLHSGAKATQRQNWQVAGHTDSHLTLTCDLVDGLCGLPGNRKITAIYEVTAPATLTLTITATTDAKTLMNFANHSYWNLDGSDRYDGHTLWIKADHYLPCDADNVPIGEIAEVSNTPMDFRQPRAVTAGTPPFDHNFCLSGATQPLRDVMTLRGQSGLEMTMSSNQTGLQVYDGRAPARPGCDTYEGLAFEAQAWPDAPNNKNFPSIEVTPDSPYKQTTQWRFTR